MAYYQVCKKCGSYLDPGEACSCEKEAKAVTKETRAENECAVKGGESSGCART